MGITQGEKAELLIDCIVCGQEFTGPGTWDVEHHEGYGTRREVFPDEDVCQGCQGKGDCEGTFKTEEGKAKYTPIPCTSREGRTRFCIEENGSRTHLGVYCDECDKFYDDGDE